VDDDLDFTNASPAPAPAPTPQASERARKEAEAGTPQLRDAGFYVSIARHSETRVPPRGGDKYVILIVEDDPDLGQLLIDIFMLSGFVMRWASNRAEINAEMKRAGEVDLILMDVILPDADGLQFLQRLRGHPKYSKMPVIMVTGKSTVEDVQAGLAAGADGYVSKPFKMSGLVKAVKAVLGIS
jgi:two-component system OmpR family response regulator